MERDALPSGCSVVFGPDLPSLGALPSSAILFSVSSYECESVSLDSLPKSRYRDRQACDDSEEAATSADVRSRVVEKMLEDLEVHGSAREPRGSQVPGGRSGACDEPFRGRSPPAQLRFRTVFREMQFQALQ